MALAQVLIVFVKILTRNETYCIHIVAIHRFLSIAYRQLLIALLYG